MWNSAFSTSLRYFAGKGNTVQFFILTKLGIFFRIFRIGILSFSEKPLIIEFCQIEAKFFYLFFHNVDIHCVSIGLVIDYQELNFTFYLRNVVG